MCHQSSYPRKRLNAWQTKLLQVVTETPARSAPCIKRRIFSLQLIEDILLEGKMQRVFNYIYKNVSLKQAESPGRQDFIRV